MSIAPGIQYYYFLNMVAVDLWVFCERYLFKSVLCCIFQFI